MYAFTFMPCATRFSYIIVPLVWLITTLYIYIYSTPNCQIVKSNIIIHICIMDYSLKVAVIGAGLAGLVAARELKREGHQVVVFEKADRLGGLWLYDPRVESDQLSGNIIHGSLYFSLRTNLPRQLMGFSDYPLTTREIGDARTFPGHEEILRFLIDFANEFGIVELIRFRNEVVRVEPVELGNEWVVESRMGELDLVSELFEAVVVCNGHYTEPIVAHLPGIAKWPGKQVHSHSYRHPTPYKNQVVVIIGKGPSAFDISREIAKVAKEVHLSARSLDIINVSKVDNHNMWQHSNIINVCEDGIIQFQDGTSVLADIILHCSGYNYSFPFLKTNGALSIEEKRVGPLYKHVFPPSLAPRISFIGLHSVSITSLVSELQAKWVAKILSGKLLLPSEEEMLIDVELEYHCLQERGIPKHKTHELGSTEFGYQDWLAAEIGVPKIDEKLTSMFTNVFACLLSQKEAFRDNFDPEKVW